jgi:hypothetical protein
MAVQAGQLYHKNGIVVDVHKVRDGEVYFQLWPSQIKKQGMFDRLYRMPVDEFEAKLDKEGGRLLDGME